MTDVSETGLSQYIIAAPVFSLVSIKIKLNYTCILYNT